MASYQNLLTRLNFTLTSATDPSGNPIYVRTSIGRIKEDLTANDCETFVNTLTPLFAYPIARVTKSSSYLLTQ